jgi:hypothetical protein
VSFYEQMFSIVVSFAPPIYLKNIDFKFYKELELIISGDFKLLYVTKLTVELSKKKGTK